MSTLESKQNALISLLRLIARPDTSVTPNLAQKVAKACDEIGVDDVLPILEVIGSKTHKRSVSPEHREKLQRNLRKARQAKRFKDILEASA